jgi:hypothetical protein
MGLISDAIRWWKATFFAGASHQLKEINNRPQLTDADFYRRFYADTDVAFDTCTRVRHVLCQQLRLCNPNPSDNVAMLFPDIDIGEVCFEIGEEFNVEYPEDVVRKLDGTVDSLIRETQKIVERGM